MKNRLTEPEEIKALLRSAKTIAVVGLSDKPDRDSFRVASYLQHMGYRIIPVNPGREMILSEKSYKSLTEVPEPIDIANVFRRPDLIGSVVDDAIAAGAKAIWLQLGIRNEEAEARAHEAGLQVVSDRCIMVDHRQLLR